MLDFLILRALGAPFNRTVCSKDNFIGNQRREHTDAQRREDATHVIEPAADFAYTRHLRRHAKTFVQLRACVKILKHYSKARRTLSQANIGSERRFQSAVKRRAGESPRGIKFTNSILGN